MYKIFYGNDIVYDPFSPNEHAYNVTCYGGINDKGDMNLTIPYGHPLYHDFRVRDLEISLMHNNDVIFTGYITQIEKDFDLNLNLKVSGILGYLGDVVLPPYTTNQAEKEEGMESVSSGPDDIFQWYMDKYNEKATHPFIIEVNDAKILGRYGDIHRSNSSYSIVGEEIESQLLETVGGYIFARKGGTNNYISYVSDVSEVNSQIIDFGVNITDYMNTEDATNIYTAVLVPGHTFTNSSGKEVEISIKDLSVEIGNEDFEKFSDNVIIKREAYTKYGYRETVFEDQDATSPTELYNSACAYLKMMASPDVMIIVKAVDLSLYMDGYRHLKPGEIVRVRSKVHGIDEYLVVTQMEIDLDDPGNTEFTLGVVYDTLTGEESSKLLDLNSNLNRAVDEVAELGDDVLANAKEIEELAQRLESTEFERSEFEEQVRDSIKDLQKIADGAIETWFYPYSPAPDKEPTSNWKTDEEKYRHIGDLFYNTETGKAFRYMYEANSQGDMVYSWGPIVDTDVEAALREASIAKDTADSKRRVFFETPYPPYDEGDLWAQGSNGNILVSTVDQRTKFTASDWVYAAKYAKAIYSTEEQFYQSNSPDTLTGGSWSTNNDWIEGKYTWRRTLVTYGDGDTEWVPSETGVCIAGNDGKDGKDGTNGKDGKDGANGKDGKDGANGKDGNGITKIVQYYLATNLSSGVTTSTPGWSETIQKISDTKPYLWNYRVIYYTLEAADTSTPVIIGHYGEDGANGENGVGIESITEYYLVSASNKDITRGSAGWSTAIPTMTSSLKYLWNYRATKYTNGITKYTEPVIIGAYGDKGEKGEDGKDGKDGKDGTNGKDGLNGEMLSGSSSSAESATAKTCTGVSGFSLYDGVCVTIYFKYGNTASNPTLNVNNTGAFPIMTNGVNLAYWTAGQAVVFVYYANEKAWYVASHPVWATEETIGNPTKDNIHINGSIIEFKSGSTVNSYFTEDAISLGNNSKNSKIWLCNKNGTITSEVLESTNYNALSIETGDNTKEESSLNVGVASNKYDARIELHSGVDRGYGPSSIYGSAGTTIFSNTLLNNYLRPWFPSSDNTDTALCVDDSDCFLRSDSKVTIGSFKNSSCYVTVDRSGYLDMCGRYKGTTFGAITAWPSSDTSIFNSTTNSSVNQMYIPFDSSRPTVGCDLSVTILGGIYIPLTGYYEVSALFSGSASTISTSCGLEVSTIFLTSSTYIPGSWSGVNVISTVNIYPIPGGTFSVTIPPRIIGMNAERCVYLVARYSGTASGMVAVGGGARTYLTVRRVG